MVPAVDSVRRLHPSLWFRSDRLFGGSDRRFRSRCWIDHSSRRVASLRWFDVPARFGGSVRQLGGSSLRLALPLGCRLALPSFRLIQPPVSFHSPPIDRHGKLPVIIPRHYPLSGTFLGMHLPADFVLQLLRPTYRIDRLTQSRLSDRRWRVPTGLSGWTLPGCFSPLAPDGTVVNRPVGRHPCHHRRGNWTALQRGNWAVTTIAAIWPRSGASNETDWQTTKPTRITLPV